MVYMCLNCGNLDIVEEVIRVHKLGEDGEVYFDDEALDIRCPNCGASISVVDFEITEDKYKIEVARRLIYCGNRIIELAKLLLEHKVVFEFDADVNRLIEKLKELNNDEGKKVAILLKITYRLNGD